MPSKLNVLSAVMLAALLQCAPGAPVEEALTDSPADDTSGEEEAPLYPERDVWDSVLGVTTRHQMQFEDEFHNNLAYDFLDNYQISSLPERCPKSNFSKEDCLHRLVDGLLTFTALLQHVEKVYPSSTFPSDIRHYSSVVIGLIRQKMRHPERVTAVTSSQESERLLRNIDSPNMFSRKMTAHAILNRFCQFLIYCKRELRKREMSRGSNRDLVLTSQPITKI
ncbi:interleukin-6-like [Chaetodon auriga]|uniref:interleukin-6-like n=1 Tax=Chaetodon auriga TaxID=39042 RepID=UPI004032C8F1